MSFYDQPILNSPYHLPTRHHPLKADGQPLAEPPVLGRRPSKLEVAVPKARRRRKGSDERQGAMDLEAKGGFTDEGAAQTYDPTPIVNEIRGHVDEWRRLPAAAWGVTPVTQKLLRHWRSDQFTGIRPFFCQVEAIETVIWLTEVAKTNKRYAHIWQHLQDANGDANPALLRIALKMATGAGKTTVMAMLIAWHACNHARSPGSKTFTNGFLIVAPGITIRDRLRVLQPSDPDSYYKSREIVPDDLLKDVGTAKIRIVNYHAFQLKEHESTNKVAKAALDGWRRDKPGAEQRITRETEGEMALRVAKDLPEGLVIINDEAHHCYRRRPGTEDEQLTGEARENDEEARLWINGLEAVRKKLKAGLVYDLSATPFFLAGSGYVEGTLFPWVVSDFSLMDAIECGIVKLPRVPVADNATKQQKDELLVG